jgi:hypothetical protein
MNTGPNGVPLREAAARLGLSVDAVRMRIKRKTIHAYKVSDRWYVVLPEQTEHPTRTPYTEPTSEHDHERIGELFTEHRSVATEQARLYLDELRDVWLQPLINQLRDQAEELGHVKAERDQLKTELEGLRATQGNEQVTNEYQDPQESNVDSEPTSHAWSRFKRWIRMGRSDTC